MTLFGEDPDFDGFILSEGVLNGEDSGLANAMENLPDTIDSLELETFLGGELESNTTAADLPPLSQNDVFPYSDMNPQLDIESNRQTNHFNMNLQDRSTLDDPIKSGMSGMAPGASQVLSSPLAIQGQLIQTTDANTGQAYLLIVPNNTPSSNATTMVQSCNEKQSMTPLQVQNTQASVRPLNKVQPVIRPSFFDSDQLVASGFANHSNQYPSPETEVALIDNSSTMFPSNQASRQQLQYASSQDEHSSLLRQTLSQGHPTIIPQQVSGLSSVNDFVSGPNRDRVFEESRPQITQYRPMGVAPMSYRQSGGSSHYFVNEVYSSNSSLHSQYLGSSEVTSPAALMISPTSASEGSQYSGSEACSSAYNTDESTFGIAARPRDRNNSGASISKVAQLQSNSRNPRHAQSVDVTSQMSRFTVSSFRDVDEVETLSYRHGSDSDYSPPPQHTITRNSFQAGKPAFVLQKPDDVARLSSGYGSEQQAQDVFGAASGSGDGKPRSTHNVIEKRYRLSINDKIVQLKNVVLGTDVKMNKSGILQRAIDYIQILETKNSQLTMENSSLKAQNDRLKEQLNASMEHVSAAANNVTALQNMVTVTQVSQSNMPTSLTGSHTNPVTGLPRPSRAPKVTRPRDEGSIAGGPSPGSSSGVGSVTSDPFSSSDSDTNAPVSSKIARRTITAGITDRSKVTLCMVMMCVLFFNPVGVIMTRSGVFTSHSDAKEQPSVVAYDQVVAEHVGNRVLQSYRGSEEDIGNASSFGSEAVDEDLFGFMSQSVVVWLVNTVVVFFILGKVFIFGEPSLQYKSDEYQTFKNYVTEADASLSHRDYASGSATLKRSLALIGCPVPVSNLDLLFSVLWRTLRLMAQRVEFGRCILRRLAALNRPKNATMKHSKEVALVYHKLFQLYLTGCVPDNKLCGVLYGLTALTMSDFAYPMIAKDKLVEIVFTCAIGCRYKLPTPFNQISRALCYYGRHHSIGVSLPAKLDWLLSPSGNDFFHSIQTENSDYFLRGISLNTPKTNSQPSPGNGEAKWCIPRSFPSMFTSCASHLRHDPLECLSQHYRLHLLVGAMQATILPLQSSCSEISSRSLALQNTMAVCGFKSHPTSHSSSSSSAAALTCRKSSPPSTPASASVSPSKPLTDCLSFWWASIINAVQAQQLYLYGGDDHLACNQAMGVLVEDMPEQLKKVDSSLPAAVQTCVIARKILLESRDASPHPTIISMCDNASNLLAEAVKEYLEPSIYLNDAKLRTLALVFCGDVLLATRKELWESMLYLDDQNREQLSRVLEAYKRDLKILKSITNVYHPAKEKCYFYETVSHMMKKAVENCTKNSATVEFNLDNTTPSLSSSNRNSSVPSFCSNASDNHTLRYNMDNVFWEKMVPLYVKRRLKAARNALRFQNSVDKT